jgi:hypothetical protein
MSTSPVHHNSAVAWFHRGINLDLEPVTEPREFLVEWEGLVEAIKQTNPFMRTLAPTQAEDAWKNHFWSVFCQTTGTDIVIRRSLKEYDSAHDFSTALWGALRGSLDVYFETHDNGKDMKLKGSNIGLMRQIFSKQIAWDCANLPDRLSTETPITHALSLENTELMMRPPRFNSRSVILLLQFAQMCPILLG